MTTQTSCRTFQPRLWALFMLFFVPGLLAASWATCTPATRDQLMFSTAETGVVLLDLSVGSMSGILCSAWLVKHFGTRKVIHITISFAVSGMLVLSLILWVPSAPLFAFGLAISGASFGSTEVVVNVEGATVERGMNEMVLPMMYGFYNFDTLFGIGVGMAMTGFGLPATLHILTAVLAAILSIAIAIRTTLDGTGENAAEAAHGKAKGLPVWHGAQLLLIGVIVLAMTFAEGSASDWLPLLMVDDHGFSSTFGSLIYANFTLDMTLGHFTGGWFIDRYSQATAVRGSVVMGALGIGLIISVGSLWVAGISILLWGIGALLGFPLAISAASDTGPGAPKHVSVVAITGYLALLVGPLLLGLLGERFGLRNIMMVVLGLVMMAVLVAHAVVKSQLESVMENS